MRWHCRVILALVLAGLLSGCAKFEHRGLSPAQTAAGLEERTLTNEGLHAFFQTNWPGDVGEWPLREWDLDRLTLAAFFYQPSLEVARAQWHVAQGGIRTAGGRLNPTVLFGPAYDSDAVSGVNPWMPFVNFDVPIETAGKRGYRQEQAGWLARAARLNLAALAWQVRTQVRAGLLNHLAARQRQALLEQQLQTQERIDGLLQQRLKAGALSSAELALSRIALARTRSDLADAERLAVEARVRLAEAIGVPVSALKDVKLAYDLAAKPANDLTAAELRRQALLNRADVLGALAEYEASQAALRLEIAKQYPNVHVNPGFVWDQGESKWQLGIGVELPVLNRNEGPIAEAAARRAEIAARFTAAQAKALAEIERATETLRASQGQLATLENLSAAQAQQRDAVRAQYQAGATDQLDWLNAQVEFNTSLLARLDGQARMHQALGALEDALQRPLDVPASVLENSPAHEP